MSNKTFFPRDWPGRFYDRLIIAVFCLGRSKDETIERLKSMANKIKSDSELNVGYQMLSEIFKGKHIRAVNRRDGTLKLHVGTGPFFGMEKKCTDCGELKNVSEFYRTSGGKYGVQSSCKECRKLYYRKRLHDRQKDVLP